jgi:hypothetical protein
MKLPPGCHWAFLFSRWIFAKENNATLQSNGSIPYKLYFFWQLVLCVRITLHFGFFAALRLLFKLPWQGEERGMTMQRVLPEVRFKLKTSSPRISAVAAARHYSARGRCCAPFLGWTKAATAVIPRSLTNEVEVDGS